MKRKILVPLYDDDAQRFDLATGILVAECTDDGRGRSEKVLILPGPSAEKLSHMIIIEGIDALPSSAYPPIIWVAVKAD